MESLGWKNDLIKGLGGCTHITHVQIRVDDQVIFPMEKAPTRLVDRHALIRQIGEPEASIYIGTLSMGHRPAIYDALGTEVSTTRKIMWHYLVGRHLNQEQPTTCTTIANEFLKAAFDIHFNEKFHPENFFREVLEYESNCACGAWSCWKDNDRQRAIKAYLRSGVYPQDPAVCETS